MADIEYSTRGADWLRDAEPDVSERVMSKLEQAAEWPDHFLDALSGVSFYKLRIGDYRAMIDWRRTMTCSSSAGLATAETSTTGNLLALDAARLAG